MTDKPDPMLLVLTDMRELLRLMAEPAIAERDKKRRATLRGIAGNSASKKAGAILLMDGARTRRDIISVCGIHEGELSVLVKKLNAAELLIGDGKQPQLAISIPHNFFEQKGGGNE
jgi:hypothetical protein